MKSSRIALLISGVIGIIALGIGAFFMFWGPDRVQIAGRSFSELLKDEDFLPVLIVPAVLLITGVTMVPFLRTIFPSEIKNGVTARAKVVEVWDTGVSINDNPQVGLLLEVRDIAGSVFQVRGKTLVSRLNAGLVQPGITAEIKYDPNNLKRVQILQLNVSAEAAAAAADKGGATGAAPGETTARLLELNTLKEKGLITEAEYAKKREEILKAL
jgi:hypothetical protein